MMQTEIERLRTELATAWEARDDYMRTNVDLRNEIKQNRARIAELQTECARWRKNLVYEELEARIAELENKNSYNLQIIKEATMRIAELEQRHQDCTFSKHSYVDGIPSDEE